MQALIERIWQEKGFAALLVTHDVTEVVALADRVINDRGGTNRAQRRRPAGAPARPQRAHALLAGDRVAAAASTRGRLHA